ncbi:6-O-methylguanine DNA methyltransferase [Gilbertella persicaria]|uniref:6-O-methylguanine DNA methyltransferase n=1 Tax=Gilbertella persicaria TaxID=101096 RepID=UPI00221E8770|nr:6-O-methylguanine DNA methyltransferase [Gilbertella persicaria]KAI8059980.1 6-O-methylguanine DNA methyltransferase [Gilbertella persicaria]
MAQLRSRISQSKTSKVATSKVIKKVKKPHLIAQTFTAQDKDISILQIPSGQVTSYKIISDTLKSSPRAVGQALKLNPFSPLPIPCHRIIASNYGLGGFSGGFGDSQETANKKAKLEAEGCVFGEHYVYKHDVNGSRDFFKDFS